MAEDVVFIGFEQCPAVIDNSNHIVHGVEDIGVLVALFGIVAEGQFVDVLSAVDIVLLQFGIGRIAEIQVILFCYHGQWHLEASFSLTLQSFAS